ncbi:holin (3TMs family) [Modicisalibacter xianhensis]|uniref:Holin (3TMs family) n=1 Tax=Modicisalibacter xianhensis TaxID=442341 RepID=A0A4R8G671_9GAMM|nr:3TM-type holin [Halomonas xianhensis]TDX30769.1 holin (3TMs family) [Halomonas xianhensis]
MEWRDAISEVAKYAPAVATALGGPAAGGIATGAAAMVTGLLGVENSPAGLVAATQDPAKKAELIRINNEHRQELTRMAFEAQAKADAEETARLSDINATMRAELNHEGVFKSGWRPAIGWVLAIAFGLMSAALSYALLRDPSQLPSIMDGIITLVVAMAAVLGVNISARSKDKRVAMTGESPRSFLDAIRTK